MARIDSILVVCLGNICRSPAAQAVIEREAAARGLDLRVDSAGLGDWHLGRPPHPPMRGEAARRGLDLSAQRARQVTGQDFTRFGLVLAADRSVLAELQAIRPVDANAALDLLAPHAGSDAPMDVLDPYYTGDYAAALDLIEAACAGVLDQLQYCSADWPKRL